MNRQRQPIFSFRIEFDTTKICSIQSKNKKILNPKFFKMAKKWEGGGGEGGNFRQ